MLRARLASKSGIGTSLMFNYSSLSSEGAASVPLCLFVRAMPIDLALGFGFRSDLGSKFGFGTYVINFVGSEGARRELIQEEAIPVV